MPCNCINIVEHTETSLEEYSQALLLTNKGLRHQLANRLTLPIKIHPHTLLVHNQYEFSRQLHIVNQKKSKSFMSRSLGLAMLDDSFLHSYSPL